MKEMTVNELFELYKRSEGICFPANDGKVSAEVEQ